MALLVVVAFAAVTPMLPSYGVHSRLVHSLMFIGVVAIVGLYLSLTSSRKDGSPHA